jgi:hypothetical protein
MAACEMAAWAVRVHVETVRKWKREFELYDGLFTVSQYGTYVRGWILGDKVRRDRVRRWLRKRVNRKPKITDTEGVFKIKHLHVWLNDVFLPSLRDGKEECDAGTVVLSAEEGDADLGVERTPGGKWKVSRSTALAWAHKLGLSFVANRKSYYCDSHDRKDVLKYRKIYLDSEFELEFRQPMWCQMAPAEFG